MCTRCQENKQKHSEIQQNGGHQMDVLGCARETKNVILGACTGNGLALGQTEQNRLLPSGYAHGCGTMRRGKTNINGTWKMKDIWSEEWRHLPVSWFYMILPDLLESCGGCTSERVSQGGLIRKWMTSHKNTPKWRVAPDVGWADLSSWHNIPGFMLSYQSKCTHQRDQDIIIELETPMAGACWWPLLGPSGHGQRLNFTACLVNLCSAWNLDADPTQVGMKLIQPLLSQCWSNHYWELGWYYLDHYCIYLIQHPIYHIFPMVAFAIVHHY